MATIGADAGSDRPPSVLAGEELAEPGVTARVLTIAGGHTAHDTYAGFLAPLLPTFIAAFGLSNTQAGLLTVFTQGPSLAQPFVGHLADRRDLRFLVILGPAITATVMSLLGLAPGYLSLAALLLVCGISSASFHAVAPAMVGELGKRQLGRSMSLWMLGGEIGATIGPLIIVAAVTYLTPTGTPWLMLGGWVGSLVLYTQLRKHRQGPRYVAQDFAWGAALRSMRHVLLPVAGIILARSLLDAALFTFMPVYLTEQGAGLWLAGGALSIMQAAGSLGVLLAGMASDRWGRRPIILACLAASSAAMFVFLSTGGWARLPVLALMGLSHVALLPVIMALIMERFPENRALATSIYTAIMFASRPLAVLIVGGLGDLVGLSVGFAASAAVMLLTIPLVFALPKPARPGPQA